MRWAGWQAANSGIVWLSCTPPGTGWSRENMKSNARDRVVVRPSRFAVGVLLQGAKPAVFLVFSGRSLRE